MATARRNLPPGAKWITLPSGAKRVELVIDVGTDPATGRRRQTRKRYRTLDEAIDAYSRIKQEKRAGTYVGSSALTVTEVCRDWLVGRRLRPGTLANYADKLKPVTRTYGALPIQKLSKRHVDDLIAALQTGAVSRADGKKPRCWKPSSVNQMLTILGMVLDDAQRQGLVVRNVVKLVDRVPGSAAEMQTYTPSEVRRVLARARSDRNEHAWHLALSGLRRGEVCGLKWSDIDLKTGRLTVRESRVSVDGQVVVQEPKTEKGKRALPLTPALVKVLRRAKRRQAAEQLKAGSAYQDSGYLVRDQVGRPLHPETVSDYWDALIKAANVRRIRLHDARHTCGTTMHLQGVPVAVIAAWLGHANAAFTMRTYVHSQDDALKDAAESLGSVTGL